MNTIKTSLRAHKFTAKIPFDGFGGRGLGVQEEGQGLAAGCIRVVLFGDVRLSLDSERDHLEVLRCEDVTRLRTLLGDGPPPVVLVDLALLTQSAAAELLKSLGRLDMLPMAISDTSEDIEGETLLRAGFVGLLRRDASTETVICAVRAIADRELWFSRKTVSRLLTTMLFEENLDRFTSREIDVLTLIGSGLNNQQIGDKLFISRETVRWHVRGLYSKLGIENRRDAREYLRSLYGSGRRIRPKSDGAQKASSRSLAAS